MTPMLNRAVDFLGYLKLLWHEDMMLHTAERAQNDVSFYENSVNPQLTPAYLHSVWIQVKNAAALVGRMASRMCFWVCLSGVLYQRMTRSCGKCWRTSLSQTSITGAGQRVRVGRKVELCSRSGWEEGGNGDKLTTALRLGLHLLQ